MYINSYEAHNRCRSALFSVSPWLSDAMIPTHFTVVVVYCIRSLDIHDRIGQDEDSTGYGGFLGHGSNSVGRLRS